MAILWCYYQFKWVLERPFKYLLSQPTPFSSHLLCRAPSVPYNHYRVSVCLWLFLPQSWISSSQPTVSLIPFLAESSVSYRQRTLSQSLSNATQCSGSVWIGIAKELFRRTTGLISAFPPKKDLILTVIHRVVSGRPRLHHRTFHHLALCELFLFWWRGVPIFANSRYFLYCCVPLLNKPQSNTNPIRTESTSSIWEADEEDELPHYRHPKLRIRTPDD